MLLPHTLYVLPQFFAGLLSRFEQAWIVFRPPLDRARFMAIRSIAYPVLAYGPEGRKRGHRTFPLDSWLMFVVTGGGVVMAAVKAAAEDFVDMDQSLVRAGWDQGADVHCFLRNLKIHHRAITELDGVHGA